VCYRPENTVFFFGDVSTLALILSDISSAHFMNVSLPSRMESLARKLLTCLLGVFPYGTDSAGNFHLNLCLAFLVGVVFCICNTCIATKLHLHVLLYVLSGKSRGNRLVSDLSV